MLRLVFALPDHDVSPTCQSLIQQRAQHGERWLDQLSQATHFGHGLRVVSRGCHGHGQ